MSIRSLPGMLRYLVFLVLLVPRAVAGCGLGRGAFDRIGHFEAAPVAAIGPFAGGSWGVGRPPHCPASFVATEITGSASAMNRHNRHIESNAKSGRLPNPLWLLFSVFAAALVVAPLSLGHLR